MKKIAKNSRLCAVVKSDAYGHDADKICSILANKVDYFAVSSNDEALKIRKNHPQIPCLVLSPLSKNNLREAIQCNTTFSVQSISELRTLNAVAKNLNKIAYYHVQVNSGMNRFGATQRDEILALLNHKLPHVRPTGIYTHFGSGDTYGDVRAGQQIAIFHALTDNLPYNLIRHFCNSQNALTHPDEHLDMIRCGLALYGYGDKNLKPVMQIFAKIIAIQDVKKGDYIGYGLKHIAKKNIRIATLAIGYAKGLPRLWEKDGFVLINNQKAKIFGNICMEATFAEISDIPAKIGDYATILSDLPTLNANTLAKSCHTIPYEILTNFRNIPLK